MSDLHSTRLASWLLSTVGSAVVVAGGVALVAGILLTVTDELDSLGWLPWAAAVLSAGLRLFLAGVPADLWQHDDVDENV